MGLKKKSRVTQKNQEGNKKKNDVNKNTEATNKGDKKNKWP